MAKNKIISYKIVLIRSRGKTDQTYLMILLKQHIALTEKKNAAYDLLCMDYVYTVNNPIKETIVLWMPHGRNVGKKQLFLLVCLYYSIFTPYTENPATPITKNTTSIENQNVLLRSTVQQLHRCAHNEISLGK